MSLRNLVESVLIPHSAFEEASRRATQCIDYVRDGGREPACLALIGESRTGKSRCIEGILRCYPMSRTREGILAPVLGITVPAKPTVKSLAEQFLKKLGASDWQKGTETQKTARFIELLRECGVLSLALDEFHHFYDKTSHKVQHHVADWIKNVVSESGVALIASGLKSLQSVIDQNEQLAGRFGAPVVMPRFSWLDADHRAEWVGILDGFYGVLGESFKLPELSDEDFAFRFYCATGGLIGYLTSILRQSVWNAVDEGKKAIRLQDFDRAYRQSVWTLERRVPSKDEVTPFDRDWNSQPNNAAVNAALSVGKPVSDIQPKPARSGGRTLASQVLAA